MEIRICFWFRESQVGECNRQAVGGDANLELCRCYWFGDAERGTEYCCGRSVQLFTIVSQASKAVMSCGGETERETIECSVIADAYYCTSLLL